MSEPLVRHHDAYQSWTIEDLYQLPDDGGRYEILNGSLLVSPMPSTRHFRITDRIADTLKRAVPPGVWASGVGVGIDIRGGKTYFAPDVIVVREDALLRDTKAFDASDVLLVVEVLSPSNARTDLVLKRHEYAAVMIPVYWIVDPEKKTVTVLEHDGGEHYREVGTFSPGERFAAEVPFPISLDPAELF
jgi:Uma2 family endonuclease